MFVLYVLLTVFLFYGVIDLLMRGVFAVLSVGDNLTQYHAVFVGGDRVDVETVFIRIQMQRFFSPCKSAVTMVVDCGLTEDARILFSRLCREANMIFCSREEFIKLTENGLHSLDKLI